MRKCIECLVEQPFEMFYSRVNEFGNTVIRKKCKKCFVKQVRENDAKNPEKTKIRKMSYIKKITPERAEATKKYQKEYYKNNRERISEYNRQYYLKNIKPRHDESDI